MKIRDPKNEAQPFLVSRDGDGPSSVQDIGLSSRRRLIRGQEALKTTGQDGGNVVPDAGFKITPPTKRPKNVVRRALHKIMKRRRHKQSAPPVVFDIEPPKLEELDIEPRLREKYEKMREQKRQAAASGEHNQLESRGMATLLVNGLSTGSVQWLRGKTRHWLESNRFTVAMTIAAVGLAILCAIIWRRCS